MQCLLIHALSPLTASVSLKSYVTFDLDHTHQQ